MLLPDNGAPWPPPQFAPELRDMCIDDAWYSGDRKRLAEVYARDQLRPDGRRRLWGRRPPAPGQRDERLHIPLAADIANTSASLLFSEPPTFTVDDRATQTRLDELTEAGGVANTLLEAAEVAAALGGVFLRVTWDASLTPRPLLTAVHADSALPEFRFGQLVAVTFWHELPSDSATVWRRLERHEPGHILHGPASTASWRPLTTGRPCLTCPSADQHLCRSCRVSHGPKRAGRPALASRCAAGTRSR